MKESAGFGLRFSVFLFRISGSGFQVSGFWSEVSGFWSRVSGFGLRNSTWIKVKRWGWRGSETVQESSGFGLRISLFLFRVLSSGFQVSGFGFRVLGFRFLVSGFGFRDSDFHLDQSEQVGVEGQRDGEGVFGFQAWGSQFKDSPFCLRKCESSPFF